MTSSDNLPIEREPYQRQMHESVEEYSLFVEYCHIPPSSRTIANLSRRIGISSQKLSNLRSKFEWDSRAMAYDHDALQLRPDPRSMDEEASIAAHLAASAMLLDLGMTAIQLKNPSLIPVKGAVELVKAAAEMQRKALGVADINIKVTHEDLSRVNKVLDEIDLLDADIVEEIDDEA